MFCPNCQGYKIFLPSNAGEAHMKHQKHYSEVIDLDLEKKIYASMYTQKKLYSRNASNINENDFIYYTDWKNHIIEQLEKFQTPTDLENFKHYCIKFSRAENWTNLAVAELAVPYIIAMLGIMVSSYNIFFSIVLLIISFLFQLIYHAIWHRKNYFYDDIIEVIEQYQEQADSSLKTRSEQNVL